MRRTTAPKTQTRRVSRTSPAIPSRRVGLPAPATLDRSDHAYPSKLWQEGLVQHVDFVGNLELLGRPAVAIIGSRHCSEKGLELAKAIASLGAPSGLVIASGYAKGVDTAAHIGALEKGGRTIFVLPFGIRHFRIKRELRPLVEESNFLALSQFPEGQPWLASAAMKRNRVVCALADAVIVIEAGDHGGTVEGAKTAKQLNKPLFAIRYSNPPASAVGNEMLISELGAIALETWADVRELFSRINSAPLLLSRSHSLPFQQELF